MVDVLVDVVEVDGEDVATRGAVVLVVLDVVLGVEVVDELDGAVVVVTGRVVGGGCPNSRTPFPP